MALPPPRASAAARGAGAAGRLAELSLVVELNVTYARAGEVDTLCCGWADCRSAGAHAGRGGIGGAGAAPLGGNALHAPAARRAGRSADATLAPVAPALEAAAARLPADVLAPAAFAPFLVAHRQLCATTAPSRTPSTTRTFA